MKLSELIKSADYTFRNLLQESTLEYQFKQKYGIDWKEDNKINKTLNKTPVGFWNELQGIRVDVGGGITVVVSVDTCSFQVQKNGIFTGSSYQREIKYDELMEYELVIEGYTYVKTTRSIAKTLAGGLLFGSLGAVAGALSENNNATLKKKNEFYFKFYIDDIELPYFEINCKTREQALRLQTTFKLWEERIAKNK